jgi:hypothetical protein
MAALRVSRGRHTAAHPRVSCGLGCLPAVLGRPTTTCERRRTYRSGVIPERSPSRVSSGCLGLGSPHAREARTAARGDPSARSASPDVDQRQPLVHPGRPAAPRRDPPLPRRRRLDLPPSRRCPLVLTGHSPSRETPPRTRHLPRHRPSENTFTRLTLQPLTRRHTHASPYPRSECLPERWRSHRPLTSECDRR